MKLKLTLATGASRDDLVISIDATATVGDLAERLRVSAPNGQSSVQAGETLSVRVNPGLAGDRSLRPETPMTDSGLRNGDLIALTNAVGEGHHVSSAAATLTVLAGPDVGRTFALPVGTSVLGRDRSADVRLSDPQVSKRHLKINVSDMVEVIDDNSANGVLVSGDTVQRAVVRSSDRVHVGETELSINLHRTGAAGEVSAGSSIEFNRSPRLDPTYQGTKLTAPEPPGPQQPARFPWISIVAPVLMAGVTFAITKNALSIMFMALSPVMMIGTYYEQKHATKRGAATAAAQYRTALRDLAVQLQYASDMERVGRRSEHPSIDEVVASVIQLSQLVWTRRPEHASFAQVRFGLGSLPSRNEVEMPTKNNTLPELWKELHDVVGQYKLIGRVPVVADLADCGNVGVGGPATASQSLGDSIVMQLAGLHSPAELVLAAITSPRSAERWNWLKWLPHSGSDHSPIATEHLTNNQKQATELIGALEDLITQRAAAQQKQDRPALPVVIVVVEDDAATERARLVQIAERGPAHRIHLIWMAASLERLPAPCRTYLEVDANTGAAVSGFVRSGFAVNDLEAEPLADGTAIAAARRLAPLVDSGALLEDQSDLPRAVSFLSLAGAELASNPDEIIEYWRGNNSLPAQPGEGRMRRDATLRALVGQAATDRYYLDLRTNGPHALVGGTTGAGKSEFLQSWIIGMATAHSPARVNFLFVDYKGGAAFADCVELPHCVGLVTDLSPHLVRRALRSLNAELRHREHILNAKKAKDLLELERRRDADYPCPPSLIIVVDEFAALVNEVPEFVDGVVNVAQRGRSLGLHLILATQRPAGVIKDNLRANTNLRVALRMADEDDSTDVIGVPLAGTFDPSIPGRGAAKTGPGRLVGFQAAYVGGHTSDNPPPAQIDVHEFRFGVGNSWDLPDWAVPKTQESVGANDIRRIVDNVRTANGRVGIAEARRPWLPTLSTTYRLEELPSDRNDTELVFGVIDRPDSQQQPTIAFRPDESGNMAVYGTGGSGKSTFLRTIAVAAGFSPARGGACHVYGLDFGARGLAMLEELPHVGAIINGDDTERTWRLLSTLRTTIDERAERYSAVNAASIGEYRLRGERPDEPRILLLVDNVGAFRTQYEISTNSRVWETFESIVADGRAVGIHVVMTADRAASLTSGLASVVQMQMALRLSAEFDLNVLGVPTDGFTETSPPGRAFLGDSEVQVAVFGGDPNTSRQATELKKLIAAMQRAGIGRAAPVATLPEVVPGNTVKQSVGAEPVLGMWDETLQPLHFEPRGMFIVAGPPQSGKTSTVLTMVDSLRATSPHAHVVLIATKRSPLVGLRRWDAHMTPTDALDEYATELATKVRSDDPSIEGLVLVIDNVADVAGGAAEDEVTELLKAIRSNAGLAIVSGESAAFNGSWGFMGAVKADRQGIVLQPDQSDGDNVLGTDFPRVARAGFPVGRGIYARAGRVYRVQVLQPEA